MQEQRFDLAFTWGYGHLLIFASGAAMGAGFAALVDIITHHSKTSMLAVNYVVAISVELYMFGLWFVRDRFVPNGNSKSVNPMFTRGPRCKTIYQQKLTSGCWPTHLRWRSGTPQSRAL